MYWNNKKSFNWWKKNKEKIDDIILSSGSTLIPKIQRMLSEYFNGKQLHKRINCGEVV